MSSTTRRTRRPWRRSLHCADGRQRLAEEVFEAAGAVAGATAMLAVVAGAIDAGVAAATVDVVVTTVAPSGRQIDCPGNSAVSIVAPFGASRSSTVVDASWASRYHESPGCTV